MLQWKRLLISLMFFSFSVKMSFLEVGMSGDMGRTLIIHCSVPHSVVACKTFMQETGARVQFPPNDDLSSAAYPSPCGKKHTSHPWTLL